MKILLDKEEQKELEVVAGDYEVSADDLFNLYEETMARNFYQDVDDLAGDNLSELAEKKYYDDKEGEERL